MMRRENARWTGEDVEDGNWMRRCLVDVESPKKMRSTDVGINVGASGTDAVTVHVQQGRAHASAFE